MVIYRELVTVFKEYIHKFLEVYFDDWTVFGLIKNHIGDLRLMLEKCRQYNISRSLKKCIFCAPFGILLGHIVCRQGLMVDPVKISVIVNLPAPNSVKQLRTVFDHIGYYIKSIKGYAKITEPMEKLLKKDMKFLWNEECQKY